MPAVTTTRGVTITYVSDAYVSYTLDRDGVSLGYYVPETGRFLTSKEYESWQEEEEILRKKADGLAKEAVHASIEMSFGTVPLELTEFQREV